MDPNKYYGQYAGAYPPTNAGAFPPQQGYYNQPQQAFGQPQPPMYPPVAVNAAGPSSSFNSYGSSSFNASSLPQHAMPNETYGQPQYGQPSYPLQQVHSGKAYPAAASFKQQSNQGYNPQPYSLDVESQAAMGFATTAVRNGFVRKVFGILTLQLLVTIGFTCFCLFYSPVKAYLRANPWPFYVSWVISFVLMLVLVCVESARRKYPTNFLLLGAFTIAEAFLVGMISSFWDIEVVLIAFVATAAVVLGLMTFATQTKYDVTRWGSALFVAGIILLVLVLVGVFWVNKIYYLVIAGAGALLFSLYLIYDMQLIMGGRSVELSPDEYIFASLTLYIDIVSIFLYLLQVVGISRDL